MFVCQLDTVIKSMKKIAITAYGATLIPPRECSLHAERLNQLILLMTSWLSMSHRNNNFPLNTTQHDSLHHNLTSLSFTDIYQLLHQTKRRWKITIWRLSCDRQNDSGDIALVNRSAATGRYGLKYYAAWHVTSQIEDCGNVLLLAVPIAY